MPKIKINLKDLTEYQNLMNDKKTHKRYRIRKKYIKRRLVYVLRAMFGGDLEKL